MPAAAPKGSLSYRASIIPRILNCFGNFDLTGNSYRTIAHYAHVNEQRVFEKWKSFEYGKGPHMGGNRTAGVQQKQAKPEANEALVGTMGQQGENANQRQIATNSSHQTEENLSRGGAAW